MSQTLKIEIDESADPLNHFMNKSAKDLTDEDVDNIIKTLRAYRHTYSEAPKTAKEQKAAATTASGEKPARKPRGPSKTKVDMTDDIAKAIMAELLGVGEMSPEEE